MDWFKKHVDTFVVLTAISGSFLWLDGKLSELAKEMHTIDKEVSIMRAVLIMQKIVPSDIAIEHKEK